MKGPNDDDVTSKEPVALMLWQSERDLEGMFCDRMPPSYLPPVPEVMIVGKGKVSQPQQAMETCNDKGKKQEIIMGLCILKSRFDIAEIAFR